MEKGRQLTESLRTPQELFDDNLASFADMFVEGAISAETFERAVARAADELERAAGAKDQLNKVGSTQAVGSALRGSGAAYSAVQASNRLQSDLARERNQMQKQELEIQKRQLEVQQ